MDFRPPASDDRAFLQASFPTASPHSRAVDGLENHPLTSQQRRSTSLLFIDQGVSDYQSLIQGAQSGIEIHVLDPAKDAVQQITETLLGREGISSLHIVSHGANGGLQLGHEWLNLYNLKDYAAQMQTWGKALTPDADILLYGCNVAQDEVGKSFVQLISQLTGADVAASDDVTGSADKGGDWTLEVNTGTISAFHAFQASAETAYHQTLAGPFVINEFKVTNTTNGWFDDEYIELLLVSDLTASQLESYFVGDSNGSTSSKVSAYKFKNMSSIATTFKAGTIIAIGGSSIIPADETVYNPVAGGTDDQWNIQLKITSAMGGSYLENALASGGNFSTTQDMVWVDDSSLGTTSLDSIAYKSSGSFGTFGTTAKVSLNASGNGLTVSFTGDATGIDIVSNYSTSNASTLALANGGSNTTYIDALRNPVTPVPVLSLPTAGSIAYTENAAATLLDSSATVNDSDSSDFDSGSLTVSFSSGGIASDRLTIVPNGTVTVDGRRVLVSGTEIGMIALTNRGIGTEALVINFNTSANATNVQSLLRAIGYRNDSEQPGSTNRIVSISLNDGDGNTSNAVTKTITVTASNDVAIVGSAKVLYNGSSSPLTQGWLTLPTGATYTTSGGVTTVDTLSISTYGGFSRTDNILNASTGFVLGFQAQVLDEVLNPTVGSVADRNGDGKPDRAGFSFTLVASDTSRAIELGFTKTATGLRIWAQEDGTSQTTPSSQPGSAGATTLLFSQAEGVDISDPGLGNYEIYVQGNTYTLFLAGTAILSGRLRNYTAANPIIDPYEVPNTIAFSDNTTAATGKFSIGKVTLLANNTIANQTINEDTAGKATIGLFDVDAPAPSLDSLASGNATLLPNANLSSSGSGSIRTIDFTPVADEFGTATVTLTYTENGSEAANRTFDVIVNPVNDQPLLIAGANPTVTAGAGAQILNSWASFNPGAANEAAQTPTYTIVSNDNSSLFAVQPTIDANGRLDYTPISSVATTQTATIGIRVQDSGGTANGGSDTSNIQTFTITVNPQQVSLTATDASATELPGNTSTYRVSRDVTGGDLIVNLKRSGSSSASDYSLSGGSLSVSGSDLKVTIPDGQSYVDITLTPTNDSLDESDETLVLDLASGTYGINAAQSSATATIVDAPVVTVSVADGTATESGSDTGTFRINRTGDTTSAMTVTYTMSGTAATGSDYTLTGTATIAAGSAFVDVVLTPTDDFAAETDETATLTLATGSAYNLGATTSGSVTIARNDTGVTNTNDSGEGSLRQAIANANFFTGLDAINFQITGSGVQTINLASALPAITDQVTLNGYSQTGATQNTLAVGNNASLKIVLNGSGAGASVNGIVLDNGADGSTIQGLVIQNFAGSGIVISGGSDGNTIRGNFIGTDVTGAIDLGNAGQGISIGSINNLIGGTTAAARNVISGNNSAGLVFFSGSNTLQGNYIGTNAAGTQDLGNSNDGMQILAANNQIGGNATGAGNVISGNDRVGILLAGSQTQGNQIQGNLIGTNSAGTLALGNSDTGIVLQGGAANNTIGGAGTGRNVISGNRDGINVDPGASSTVIQNNYIGTDVTGTVDLGNTFNGINLGNVNNIVSGNLISGNNAAGVSIYNNGANNILQGNRIGTQADGSTALGNGSHGVSIASTGTNTIGGTSAGNGNTIAFNGGDGVFVQNNTNTGNRILGNAIQSNLGLGIDLGTNGVTNNDLGDADTGANNLQNFPILYSVSSTAIGGSLNSLANTTYRIEFFANATGGNEGEVYLGFQDVTTNASGNVLFNYSYSPVAGKPVITATATNLTTGDTSEFSIVNQAPRLTADATLSAILEDASTLNGATISSLFSSKFSDPDAGASLSGLAIVGNAAIAATEGIWQYSTNGTDWYAIGTVADDSTALALAATSKLRFVPAVDYNGNPPTLNVRAIDNTYSNFTDGPTRVTIDAASNGGQSALSTDIRAINTSVVAVNDQPDFTAANPAAIDEGSGSQILNSWAAFAPGATNETQTASYTVSNISNTTLFDVLPSIAADGALTYTPKADAFGTVTFDVVVQDSGGTANGGIDTSVKKTFTITINGVNDKPTFTASNPPPVNEDSPTQAIANWASFDPGVANESGQKPTYTVSEISDASLFDVLPTIAANGTLSYKLKPNAFGTVSFKVTVQDDGGTGNGGIDTSDAKQFTLTINPVNDKPSFTLGANQTVFAGTGQSTVGSWATGFNPGAANETAQTLLGYEIVSIDKPDIFAIAPTIAADGTLSFAPVAGLATSTTARIGVRVQDSGGTLNGGKDLSDIQYFTVTVNPQVISLAATDKTASESVASIGTGTYQISRNSGAGDRTVTLTIDPSSTASLSDYSLTANAGTLTIVNDTTLTVTLPDTVTTIDLTLTAVDDTIAETQETLKLTLAATATYAVQATSNSGEVSILANDPVVSILPITRQATEGNQGQVAHNFRVKLSNASDQVVTVDYATIANTATESDNDFIGQAETLTFQPNQLEQTITVYSNGDAQREPDETFSVELGSVSNGSLANTAKVASSTIANDDGLSVYQFASTKFAVAEGNSANSAQVVKITRSNNINVASTVDVILKGGTATAGQDFVAHPIRVRFAAGQTTASVPISLLGDTQFEPNETINLSLANPSANSTIAPQQAATLTLTNDDSQASYSFSSEVYRVKEGKKTHKTSVVTVSRTGDWSKAATIAVKQAGGKVMKVQFAAGQKVAVVPITIKGNSKAEPDKKIKLSLVNLGEHGLFGSRTSTTLIVVNDDGKRYRFLRRSGKSGFQRGSGSSGSRK